MGRYSFSFSKRLGCNKGAQKTGKVVRDMARKVAALNSTEELAEISKGQFMEGKLLVMKHHDEALLKLPNRMVTTGSLTYSSLCSKQGRRGINQDAIVVWEGFTTPDTSLFAGVFDGHGLCGHLVANRVRNSLPTLLAAKFLAAFEAERKLVEDLPSEVQLLHLEEQMFKVWEAAHAASFKSLDNELRHHPLLEGAESGASVITALVQDNHLIVANLGESHCVLAVCGEGGEFTAQRITEDNGPDDEAKDKMEDCLDFPRSVSKRKQLRNQVVPWPAVKQSLGNGTHHEQGGRLHPRLHCRQLEESDKFLILASDGLWDVMDCQEAVDIVASCEDIFIAANEVVGVAEKKWAEESPTCPRDDISVIVVYLADLRFCQAS